MSKEDNQTGPFPGKQTPALWGAKVGWGQGVSVLVHNFRGILLT